MKHTEGPMALFSADSKRLAWASDSKVRIWDVTVMISPKRRQ